MFGLPLLASAAASTGCTGAWAASPTSLQAASWMSYRLDCLESQVAELAEEVRLLRAEVSTLRRQLAEREERSVPASPAASAFGSSAGSYSAISAGETSVARCGGERRVLSWESREAICDRISVFIVKALNGQFHGASGRDEIDLPSRVWVVFRSYGGEVFDPVRVFHRFALCKDIVKVRGDCGPSVFIGLPSEREARRVVQGTGRAWPSPQ